MELGDACRATIGRDVRDAGDCESCGLLLGVRRRGVVSVDRALPAANVARDPHREFEVDPGAVVVALAEAERVGRELVGVYHSHPRGPARPSRRDLDELWPGWVMILATPGRGGAELRAWGRAPGGCRERPLGSR